MTGSEQPNVGEKNNATNNICHLRQLGETLSSGGQVSNCETAAEMNRDLLKKDDDSNDGRGVQRSDKSHTGGLSASSDFTHAQKIKMLHNRQTGCLLYVLETLRSPMSGFDDQLQ